MKKIVLNVSNRIMSIYTIAAIAVIGVVGVCVFFPFLIIEKLIK